MRRLLQHWTESSINLTSKEGSVWRHKKPKKRTVSFAEDRSLTWSRVLPGHWSQWFCRELCRPIYNCSSKWWKSGIRFEMGRKFCINDKNPIWWHLGRTVQTKNTRVWEAQDRIGIVWPGDSSEESRTWLSQIEDDGEKKYRHDLRFRNFEARNGNYVRSAMSGNFKNRHHVEQRVKLSSPREESFPIPLKIHWRLQNYSYEFGC